MQNLVSRLGVVFIFVSFGIWEIINPGYWTAFVPQIALMFGDPILLVKIHGLVLTIIGLGILSGFYLRYFAIAGALLMLEIVITLFTESGWSDILVRDIGILLFTISLIF